MRKITTDKDKIYSTTPPPYDVIGDVHGCREELEILFDKLGYKKEESCFINEGRMPIFLGDLTDRGPDSIGVIKTVLDMTKKGLALFIPGNHDNKLARWMVGNPVKLINGLEFTAAEFERLSVEEVEDLKNRFLSLYLSSPPYLILDEGRFIVAHGGLKNHHVGRTDGRVERFVLYGDVTGRIDKNGLPERLDWAADYDGDAFIVYGHTPTDDSVIRNNTVNIDGGCVFGGNLRAFRYPEMEIIEVKAKKEYYVRNIKKQV